MHYLKKYSLLIIFTILIILFPINLKADIKQSSTSIKINNKRRNRYLSLSTVPSLGFNNIRDNQTRSTSCICKQNDLVVHDNRKLASKCDYCINVSLDKFKKNECNNKSSNKNIAKNFQLSIGKIKLNSGQEDNNEVITHKDFDCSINKIKLIPTNDIDSGQYVGKLNWQLQPTIYDAN